MKLKAGMKADKKSAQISCIRIISVLVLFFYAPAFAQKQQQDSSITGIEDWLKEKIENIAENSEENTDYTTLLSQLNYFREYPLNLNEATYSDLQELLLLNDIQVNALLDHIRTNGKLIALEELQAINGFDRETINRLLPFVTLEKSAGQRTLTPKKILYEGNSRLILRYQRIIENQKGYQRNDTIPFTDNKWYAGNPGKCYLRYKYTLAGRLRAGFTAEKDAGEPFIDSDTLKQGFDFYSAHLFYYSKNFVRTVALGDYQVQYGQGLVAWSGLAFGKSADVLNVKKNPGGIIPYSSVDENIFMRGGAASLGLKKFQADIFYSDKKIDGSVASKDALEEEVISVTETGKHRTFKELSGRKTLAQKIFGGHTMYSSQDLNIGFTVSRTEFGDMLRRDLKPYNQFTFNGIAVSTYGIDYSYLWKNISFFGETGGSDNDALATINGVMIALDKNASVAVVNRHYEKDYIALQGKALGENTLNANENGTYMALSIRPVHAVVINSYFDRFNFPWLKYLVSAPSDGYEILSQITFTPSKTFETYLRYRERSKPRNELGNINPVDVPREVVQKNYRLNLRYGHSDGANFTSRLEWVNYLREGQNREYGFMILQEVEVKISRKISAAATYILFDTDSYNTRIYAYETDVLYSYSVPFYFYRGNRYILNLHCRISGAVDFWIRYSQTRYSNLSSIGSILDEIDGNTKSEIKVQTRFTF